MEGSGLTAKAEGRQPHRSSADVDLRGGVRASQARLLGGHAAAVVTTRMSRGPHPISTSMRRRPSTAFSHNSLATRAGRSTLRRPRSDWPARGQEHEYGAWRVKSMLWRARVSGRRAAKRDQGCLRRMPPAGTRRMRARTPSACRRLCQVTQHFPARIRWSCDCIAWPQREGERASALAVCEHSCRVTVSVVDDELKSARLSGVPLTSGAQVTDPRMAKSHQDSGRGRLDSGWSATCACAC